VGQVEPEPLIFTEKIQAGFSYIALRGEIYRYLSQIHQLSRKKTPFKQPPLPTNIETLAYLAGSVLQLPPHEKQYLLEIEDDVSFLEEIRRLLRREISLRNQMNRSGTRKGFERRN
jgi:hypothetical protein